MTTPGLRDERILAELDAIRGMARGFARRLPPQVDSVLLEEAAVEALVRAADSYDPSTSVPFGKYAVMQAQRALVDTMRTVYGRNGCRRRAEATCFSQIQDELLIQGLPTRESSALHKVMQRDLHEHALATLAARDATRRGTPCAPLFRMLYEKHLGQKQAAAVLGLTRARISQMHKDGLEFLRRVLAA